MQQGSHEKVCQMRETGDKTATGHVLSETLKRLNRLDASRSASASKAALGGTGACMYLEDPVACNGCHKAVWLKAQAAPNGAFEADCKARSVCTMRGSGQLAPGKNALLKFCKAQLES